MSDAPLRCLNCGRVAAAGAGDWTRVRHPSLGRMTQCVACGSTDVRRTEG